MIVHGASIKYLKIIFEIYVHCKYFNKVIISGFNIVMLVSQFCITIRL